MAKKRPAPRRAPAGADADAEAASEYGNEPAKATSGVAVVGLGGSAGALECFKAFFEAMPPESGAAFVVIQHLAPTHASLLTELLAAHTRMKVAQAQDGVPVEPNHVYIIPPNEYLGIRDGILYLAEPVKQDGIRMPIDFFFRSLAEDRRERAVCVLFSGAGSDGTLGVRAIRSAGGLAIVQDPSTAQYADMPRSAIATKLVDFILPPDQMPQTITEYLRQPYVRGGQAAGPLVREDTGDVREILAIVQARTGCDFRCYKKGTILRRIERRMGLHRLLDIAQYCKLLRQDADEVKRLYKDLLINVTAFFRDAEAFEELRNMAIAPLVAAKGPDEALRVWAPGCSTGEEAYSLAILLMEELAAADKSRSMQIFATDIDEEALEFARRGLYPKSIVADVSPQRLARFFLRKEQGYQVSEALRNSVVFATQNLTSDPPFSKMDIICCRNLLIYLDGQTQLRLLPVFNFALNEGGYLFLGKSEGIAAQNDLFAPISRKAKIYRRNPPGRPVILNTPILPGRKMAPPAGPAELRPPGASYAEAIRQALLGHFAAGIALVDRKGRILQFHGQTGKYLNMPTAEPNLNLLEIAKEGLSSPLRSALHAAVHEGKSAVLDQVPITREKGTSFVRITVSPVVRRGEAEGPLAVIFEDTPRPATARVAPAPDGGGQAAIRRLEDELKATQQDLQSSIEDLQSANEELRVSNEEVVSSNEELQSTNEELETSKEELQSVNEELTTVNSQLQEKVERLAAANSDMANLLTSTQIGTLFLDSQLRIKLFTQPATRVLKLIPSDIGRPLGDLSTNLIGYDLTADARSVAQGGAVIEREAAHADGSIHRVRVMPYLAQEGRVDGVVATFDDVTSLRLAEQRSRRLATVVTDSNDAVILFDPAGSIQAWNRGAQTMYGWSEEEALRMNIRDLATAEEAAGMDDHIRRVLAGENVASYETHRRPKDGRVLDIWVTITAVPDESKKIVAVATTERDITGRKAAEEALKESEERFRGLFDSMAEGFALHEIITDERGRPCDYRFLDINAAFERMTGLKHDQVVNRSVREVLPEIEPFWIETYGKVALTGEPTTFEKYYPAPLDRWYEVFAYRPAPRRFAAIFLDVSARKRAEEELLRLNRTLKALGRSSHAMVRAEQEKAYLYQVCQIIVEDCGHAMVWIGYAENDEAKGVRPVASAGFEEGYLETLQLTWADTQRGRGPTGTAIRTGKPAFCRNMLTDPLFAPWREQALARGYASSLVLPLLSEGKAFGALTIYFRAPDPFKDDEVRLLMELADDLAHGITALRLGAAHKRTEETLQFLVQCGTGPGEDFFQSLARYLGQNLGMDYVCIDRLEEGSLTARTVAVHFDGKFEDNVTYAVKDTPCGNVVEKNVCCFPKDVRRLFPKDQVLQDMRAESYVGTLLYGSQGKPIGLIAVIGRKPLTDPDLAKSILQLAAVRAAGEMERQQAEEELREAKEQLELRVRERTAELTEALRALRQSGAYTRSLIEASPDPLVTIGPDGTITDVNAATEEATGVTRRELVGTDFSTYFSEPEKARTGYQRVFAEGSIRDYPLEIRHRDGHTIPVLYNAAVYRDEAGAVVGIFAAARDITERKRAEAALREAQETLERRVAERTAEFARSNEDLQQFAYIASHDLQEPLRMVTGFLNILRDRYAAKLDEKALEYIAFSCDGATRMADLIHDLLQYSRVGSKGLNPVPVIFADIVKAAQANLRVAIEESQAVITCDPLPSATVDAAQMMQLFQNLIGNALKFRAEGRAPEVHIGAQQVDNEWVFQVKDNGIGIDPAQTQRIFLLYQRLHTRGKYEGTGIGLSICKKIVERHGGRIWVESTPGQGATFRFTLPANATEKG